ncbi:uncharacterized protein [Equus przewalskii]|uniref:Uncharacterized protein n=1 Tax=Equus przewalskii TaxID=9798 RepID=A0ABM4MX00_EQUPR
MSTWKARLTKRLKSPSRRMHPFPCSALLACFGNARDSAPFDQPSTTDAHSTIYIQPMAKAGGHPSHPRGEEGTAEKRRDSGTHSERNGSANQNSSNHAAVQPVETPEDLPGSLDVKTNCEEVAFQTSIPRPSIIEMPTGAEVEERMEGLSASAPTDSKKTTIANANCHVRSMNILRPPGWEKSTPQEGTHWMRSHVERGSRCVSEEATWKGILQPQHCPPAPADAHGSELNSPAESFPNSLPTNCEQNEIVG